MIEEQLRSIAMPFSGALSAEAVRYRNTWWNHTLIQGGNVSLTECPVPNPDHVVRWSHARNQYAAGNKQKWLFDHDVEPENKSLYAILLHGRDIVKAGRLGFAIVRFPLPKLTGYYEARIDLFKEFPSVIAAPDLPLAGEQAPPEQIDDLPDIDVRDDEEPLQGGNIG